MDNTKKVREGEILMLLVKRSGKEGREVADALGITPGYLSTLYKSEMIRMALKKRVAEYFNVGVEVFDSEFMNDVPVPDMVGEPEVKYDKPLKFENMTMAGLLEYLERKDMRYHEERSRLIGLLERKEKNHQEERGILLATIEKLAGK